ncbi:hypothetical protein [Escherichia coli]|uniref:hypothetical protein n=1 Tax=Escherichia coli TaxID=562 RepID=UPI00207BDD57|nr:hypothetical protein [Escherichia coli]
MSAITLRKALGVLAKSSSFSVTTVTHRQKDDFTGLSNIQITLQLSFNFLFNKELFF